MFSVTTCPVGWIMREEFCYLGVEKEETWQSASNGCIKKGGNLVSIHNKEEDDFIFQG